MNIKEFSNIDISIYYNSKYEINKFLSVSANNKPLLFFKNINSIKSDFLIDYKYIKIDLGMYLLEFLNLDLTKYNDFFKFFCSFIVEYIDEIPEKDRKQLLADLDIYTKYFDIEEPKHIVNLNVLEKYAKKYYEDKKEIEFLINKQTLFKKAVDYIFNNNKDSQLSKMNTYQRFYIFEHINKNFQEIATKFKCDFKLNFSIHNHDFMYNLLYDIKDNNVDPLSDEKTLIKNILKNDPNGENINGGQHNFKTNDIFTYFYIVLYYITLNKNKYIKKCNICRRYFFAEKENTLFCNNKYITNMTCKEYGIKTSQKRKEQEEPVYKKYRQIYAKKAMMVKRNPDIESYKINYEKWKIEARQFIQDIKSGKKTYDEFNNWLL